MHKNEKKPIFFTDNVIFTRRKAEVIECGNLDDYIASVSTYVTFNNIFGVWKEHWDSIDEKSKYSSLKLQQVDWTYQIITKFGENDIEVIVKFVGGGHDDKQITAFGAIL